MFSFLELAISQALVSLRRLVEETPHFADWNLVHYHYATVKVVGELLVHFLRVEGLAPQLVLLLAQLDC